MKRHEIAIVGAGPAGLAVAIAATQMGLDHAVLEKGVLVNSVFRFPRHMTFFTTPDLLEIGGLPFVTPYEKPTQAEALRYYRRVAETYRLAIELGVAVDEIAPDRDGFLIHTRTDREVATRGAANVVLATGYYDQPNVLGIPGEDLPHVSHYYTEAHAFYRKDVVVVGGKNSAAIAALELCRAGARVTLVHRRASLSDSVKYWIRPDIDNRIKEGAVTARFSTRIVAIGERTAIVEDEASARAEIPADAVLLMTGYRPDPSLLLGAGASVDPETLRPRCDPGTFETDVPGLFVAGSAVSGKETGKIFIETGRFHGEAIVRSILRRSSPAESSLP